MWCARPIRSIVTPARHGEGLGPETGGEMKGRWAVLALVALGTFMTTLDASIVNISLPSIARTFHTPIGSAVERVIIAYLIVIAATLLTFGRLSDLVGRKSVWVVGLAIFTLGSIFCGAAARLLGRKVGTAPDALAP